jgi:hypothetical protein
MLIDRKKLEMAKARACFNTSDLLKAANIPRGTYNSLLNHSTSSKTVGKLAKALGVDILEILKDPDQVEGQTRKAK